MLSHITTHFIFSLDFFCNHICLLQQHHTTQKYAIWWSGWSAVKILWWNVGSTPRTIRHGPRKLLGSSLGANKNSEHGRPLGANHKPSKLWGPCSIHILTTPFFLAQSAPSGVVYSFLLSLQFHTPGYKPRGIAPTSHEGTTARQVVHTDMRLSSRSDYCWSSHNFCFYKSAC